MACKNLRAPLCGHVVGIKHVFDAHRQAVHGPLDGLAIQPMGLFQGGLAGDVGKGMNLRFMFLYLIQTGLDIGFCR